MARRIHVPRLSAGTIPIDAAQAHHARDVLRLESGTTVEVFDDSGAVGSATVHWDAPGPRVEMGSFTAAAPSTRAILTIAAAVPKGDRADWMVEKLSELGVEEFIPLAADRSVVLPEGRSKHDRWVRIATEAAKQSRRRGVMRIAPLTKLQVVLSRAAGRAFCLSTEPGAIGVGELKSRENMTVLVGPEGGWSDSEIGLFDLAAVPRVSLGATVLRIETAAVAIAAICMANPAVEFDP